MKGFIGTPYARKSTAGPFARKSTTRQSARKSTARSNAAESNDNKLRLRLPTARKSTSRISKTSGNRTNKGYYRPGVVALKEIRRYQKTTDLIIRKLPFQRLLREILLNLKTDYRFQVAAVEALQVCCVSLQQSEPFQNIFYRKRQKLTLRVYSRTPICVLYMHVA